MCGLCPLGAEWCRFASARSPFGRYILSLYWSVTTITTVGYGTSLFLSVNRCAAPLHVVSGIRYRRLNTTEWLGDSHFHCGHSRGHHPLRWYTFWTRHPCRRLCVCVDLLGPHVPAVRADIIGSFAMRESKLYRPIASFKHQIKVLSKWMKCVPHPPYRPVATPTHSTQTVPPGTANCRHAFAATSSRGTDTCTTRDPVRLACTSVSCPFRHNALGCRGRRRHCAG